MAVPDPEAAFPRVLGVDDFAIRRGQHYGTLLIDCETAAPLDLIEGRDARPLTRAFAGMLTELTGQGLPQGITAARDAGLPGMASFAMGLEHDLHAVTNGLTLSWSSGPVEGRVNHIKMVKRQMFGRAGLLRLRKRVLLTAKT
jgi:transposase